MVTILLQMLLFGLPALIYIWAAMRNSETTLMLLSVCLVALGLLAGGEGINQLAPLVFLPLALLGFLRALRPSEPTFGSFSCSGRHIMLGALWGALTAAIVLACAGMDLGQKVTDLISGGMLRLPWLLVVGSALGSATGEELFFRTVVLSEVKQKVGNTWVAILIVSLYFAFTHLNRIMLLAEHSFPMGRLYILSLLIGAIACGYLKLSYGVASAIAWHSMFNLIILSLK